MAPSCGPSGAEVAVLVNLDRSKCQGHAQCHVNAPGVFDLDDEGYIVADGDVLLADDQEAAALRAVAACPEGVFSLVDGPRPGP
jgi:ferredoxin